MRTSMIGFVRFIQAQEPTKLIDHEAGWCDCAIGEYMAATNGFEPEEIDAEVFSATLERSAQEKFNDLYLALERTKFNQYLPTYGNLQGFINNGFKLDGE